MKNFNDTIGNRTRDRPTCSAVPQPTAPPCAIPILTRRDYGKLRENPRTVDAKAENLTDQKSEKSSLEASRPAAQSSNTG
jgi:hypothetical protein